MGKLMHISRRHESGTRRTVETKHSPSQKAVKELAKNSQIKSMMKDLVYGIGAEEAKARPDTYAPMRKVAGNIEKIDDIVVDDRIIEGAMFLAHFHAMQGIYGDEQDCWDAEIADHSEWGDCVEKRIPSDHVRKMLFGRELDG